MNFGEAVMVLRAGQRVTRAGWNGTGMFLFRIDNWTASELGDTGRMVDLCPRQPFIAMKTADDAIVPWLASQTDVLAEDWQRA